MDQLLKRSVLILILDYIWINYFLINPFSDMINSVQKEPMTVRFGGVLVAYTSLIFLVNFLIDKIDSDLEAFLTGFAIYAVYDGTNYATLKGWDAKIATVDSLWGGVLFVLLKKFSGL